jgi:hypothetical protein
MYLGSETLKSLLKRYWRYKYSRFDKISESIAKLYVCDSRPYRGLHEDRPGAFVLEYVGVEPPTTWLNGFEKSQNEYECLNRARVLLSELWSVKECTAW